MIGIYKAQLYRMKRGFVMKYLAVLAVFFLVGCNILKPAATEVPEPIEETAVIIETETSTSQPPDTPVVQETVVITPAPYVLQTCVQVNGLKIRSGPGMGYESIGFVQKGECIDILGISADQQWVKIETGWLSAKFLAGHAELGLLDILEEAAGE